MDAQKEVLSGPCVLGTANVVGVLRRHMQQAHSMRDKLLLLSAAQEDQPWLEYELERELSRAGKKGVMLDDALRLMQVWHLHRFGDAAGRDYYLHAFERAQERAEIRDALGISFPSRPQEVVLLVTVECLRGDRVGRAGSGRRTSPALGGLAAEGVCFPRAYSTAGHAAQSFPGIMLSNFYQSFGRQRPVPEHLTSLADVMSRNGFYTVGINAANPHVSHFYGYDKGFDEFYDFLGQGNFVDENETFTDGSPKRRDRPTDQELAAIFEDCQAHPDVYDILRELTGREGMPLVKHIAARRRLYPYGAGDIVRAAIGSIQANADKPRLFCWVHLMDLHENVTVPFSRVGTFSVVEQFLLNALLSSPLGPHALRGQAAKYVQMYDSALDYMDLNLQILLNCLSDSGVLRNSLVCLTADHGQELLERGAFGHGHDRLSEDVVHVPLIFAGGLAGRIAGETDRAVSTLDIAPTILDACGIREAPASFVGKSLNENGPRRVYGQTFYAGAENRCASKEYRLFELKPYPRPVKECCKEMLYCIEGDCQVIHDAGSGRTEVRRLRSAALRLRAEPSPDARCLAEQAAAYLASVYRPPGEQTLRLYSEQEAESLERKLRELSYL